MSNIEKTQPHHLIDVPEAELDDLRTRLRGTRWATPWPLGGWDAGVDREVLRRLVDHWASTYDWRKHEAAINALPSRSADIGGTTVHYLRFDAERPGAPAILLANGWPSSFLELTGLAERLSAPSRHGGDPEAAFTVVVPSLPGYGFSRSGPRSAEPCTPTTSGTGHARRTRLRALRRPRLRHRRR